jgi:hypothetical protein
MPSKTILNQILFAPSVSSHTLARKRVKGKERLSSDEQIKILALASRAVQDRHLLQSLMSVQTSQETMKVIFDWEGSNEFSPSKLS